MAHIVKCSCFIWKLRDIYVLCGAQSFSWKIQQHYSILSQFFLQQTLDFSRMMHATNPNYLSKSLLLYFKWIHICHDFLSLNHNFYFMSWWLDFTFRNFIQQWIFFSRQGHFRNFETPLKNAISVISTNRFRWSIALY